MQPNEFEVRISGLKMKRMLKVNLLLIALAMNAGCKVDYCEEGEGFAAVVHQRLVKAELVSPSTATFQPSHRAVVRKSASCRYFVASYVDSQNRFGAEVRTRYTLTVIYDPRDDSWRMEDFRGYN